MALNIRWTTRADIKLDQLIIYLESEWGESVVKAFMKRLYDFLEILSEFPEIGSMQYPEKGIRGFPVFEYLISKTNLFSRMFRVLNSCYVLISWVYEIDQHCLF